MRTRKWVLFLFALLFGFIVLLMYGMRLFKANDRIKTFILNEIRPVLGEKCNISQVKLGFGQVHILDVIIPLPDKQFTVHAQDIKIGLNIFNLLLKGFVPEVVSQDIVIVRPRLFVHIDQTGPVDESQNILNYSENISELRNNYKEQIKRLDFLKRLSIINGEIYYDVNDTLQVMLANSIEGGFFLDRSDSIEIRLEGKLFSSNEENLSLTGKADVKDGTISYIKALLKNYKFNDDFPAFIFPFLHFIGGELNGNIYLHRKASDLRKFDISGGINITNASAESDDGKILFTETNVKSHLEKWNLIIDHATQKINDADVILSGRVHNVLYPELEFELHSSNMRVEKFNFFKKEKKEKIRGFASMVTKISGSWDNYTIANSFYSAQININGYKIKNVKLLNSYSRNSLKFYKSEFDFLGNHVLFDGNIDLKSKEKNVTGKMSFSGNLYNDLKPFTNNLSSCPSWFNAQIGGNLNELQLNGSGGLVLINSLSDSTALNMRLDLKGSELSFNSENTVGSPIVRGKLDWKTKPGNIHISVTQIQKLVTALFQVPHMNKISRQIAVEADLSGNFNNMILQSKVNWVEGGYFTSEFITLHSKIINKKSELLSNGYINFYPNSKNEMSGQFSIKKDKQHFILQNFDLDNNISAFFHSKKDIQGNSILSGKIKAINTNLSKLFNRPDSLIAGNLDLGLDIMGSLESPVLDAKVKIKDFSYESIGPYDTNLEFKYNNTRTDLDHFSLNTLGSTLLFAQGHYNAEIDSLDFYVKGAGFDVQTLLNNKPNSFSYLTGNTLVDLVVTGKKVNPEISGVIAIKSGTILHVPFDEIEINLDKNPDFYSGLNIQNFRLTRRDKFQVNGSGLYPFAENDSLQLNLNGSGNFLTILSDLVPFFKNPQSNGTLNAIIKGTPAKPRLESAKLQFQNGKMTCKSVIPALTNITAECEFIPENQFIHIKNLSGLMGGEKFNIHNIPANPNLSVKSLSDIILGDTELNLGVIIPETTNKGIPLNISGLMEPGVYGNIIPGGRNGEQNFYFAFIDDRPTLRGILQLYNCEIMFPFYEDVGTPSDVITNFLNILEWDIIAKPIKDVRYVRTFPGGIDNVYVNMQLNNQDSQLDFTGQINDESFRIIGQVRSTKGIIEYLGMNFRIESAGADFDRSTLEPVVYGNARTTIADSSGIPSQILLTMQTFDETMDKKSVNDLVRQEDSRGRWNQIRFKLSSDNPTVGSTESQILSSLGYSKTTFQKNPAIDAIGYETENILFRPIIRPMERTLEKTFGLDYVRFSSRFTKNLIDYNLNNNIRMNNRLAFLKSTRLVVGKYLADRFFLQYTGQVESGIDYKYKDINVGLHHQMGLEYQINPRLLLELEYDYDSLIWNRNDRDDKRIVLRHWFPF